MNIPSIEFLLPLIAISAVFFLLSPSLRQLTLAFCNASFFAMAVPDNSSRLALILFVLSGYGTAKILQRKPGRALFAGYTVLLVLVFAVLKHYSAVTILLPGWVSNHPIGAVGLSYILFRQIHFLLDVKQGQIIELSLWSYLNYQFNLFGFISGPIQRYQEFDSRWRDMPPLLTTGHEVLRAYLRMFVGVIKVVIISSYFLANFEMQRRWFLHPGDLARLGRPQVIARFAVVFYGYPIYLYFNFSGYCDVVISGAALLGIKMPENFDRPYLSRNVSDYWTRFHQSLGFWIRDYLFTPMYKAAATRWSDWAQWLVFPCYLIAFIVAGVWHGNSFNFLVYGLLHGLGICAGKLWEMYLIKQRGRKGFKAYLASPGIRIAAIMLTLNFVSFTMLFFPGSVRMAMDILRNFADHIIHHG